MNFRISLSVSADPEVHVERQRTRNSQMILKKNKLLDSHFLISKLTEKPWSSRQCGTGIRTDIQIGGTELRIHK